MERKLKALSPTLRAELQDAILTVCATRKKQEKQKENVEAGKPSRTKRNVYGEIIR